MSGSFFDEAASRPTAAMMAWIGIRPLAMSCPPARRMAEAKGAAHVFSYTSTAATLPGVMAAARCSTSSS